MNNNYLAISFSLIVSLLLTVFIFSCGNNKKNKKESSPSSSAAEVLSSVFSESGDDLSTEKTTINYPSFVEGRWAVDTVGFVWVAAFQIQDAIFQMASSFTDCDKIDFGALSSTTQKTNPDGSWELGYTGKKTGTVYKFIVRKGADADHFTIEEETTSFGPYIFMHYSGPDICQ